MGGRFTPYGNPCSAGDSPVLDDPILPPYKGPKIPRNSKNKISLKCSDNLQSDKLSSLRLSVGESVSVTCTEACGTDEDYNIYGYKTYSEDSSICKAAVHCGAIENNANANIDVKIVDCPNTYESNSKPGDSVMAFSRMEGCTSDDETAFSFEET